MEENCHINTTFKNDHVLVRLEGQVTVDKILETTTSILRSQYYLPGFPQIWDVSLTDLSGFDDTSIELTVIRIAKLKSPAIPSKIGLVSENDINRCSMALFKEYYEVGADEIRIFNTIKEAKDWVLSEAWKKTSVKMTLD